jgi:predicted Zn finger-like uncharacterized protein
MDVRCARCGIEYEFDDALISERGTMVRCTECGHQFRVHPSHVIPGAPDEWRVITREGQSVLYRTLRELQQGITQGQVGRDATLVRGSNPPRPLGTIAELDPFFPTRSAAPREQSTLTGVAPPPLETDVAKSGQPAAKSPIARIGLNSVQVSASGVGLAVPRAAPRPRKTTLGMGEKVPPVEKTSEELPDETELMAQPSLIPTPPPPAPVMSPPAAAPAPGPVRSAPEPAAVPSPEPAAVPSPEPAAVPPPELAAALVAKADDKPPLPPRRQEQPQLKTVALTPTAKAVAQKQEERTKAPSEPPPPRPAVATTLTKPVAQKQEERTKAPSEPPPPRPAVATTLTKPMVPKREERTKAPSEPPPRPAIATPAAKAVTQKQEERTNVTSEPPTLRGGETPPSQQTLQKRPGSAPPRPGRSRGPTIAGGYDAPAQMRQRAPTLVGGYDASAKAPPAAQPGPVKVVSYSNAITDPPAAIRTFRDETLISEPQPPRIDKPEPTPDSFAPHAVFPPALDPSEAEESVALVFQAEAPPMESPVSAPTNEVPEPENERATAGSFVPTVPPKRLLSLVDGVASSENRARSSRIGRWLMAFLLIVLLSLVALWWRSRTSARHGGEVATGVIGLDQYLHSANEALHAGDLVRAHDQLQASQTLGGRDARWVTLTARYDVMRADMNWLAVRLADPNDTAHVETFKRELSENVAQATRALNSIERLAVNDPELAAARIDAQRLRGEVAEARKSADAASKANPSPELAYSLAVLELLGDNPNYKGAFDWLGRARAADGGLGRAPVMLIVACVMSQRIDCARAELARLKSAQRPHPLLTDIEAFVGRATNPAASAETGTAAAPEASAAPLPDAGSSNEPAAVAPSEPAAGAAPGDPLAEVIREGDTRLRLRRGVETLGRGELTKAELYFRSVLASRPNDTEALTGMGDVARKRGNTANAVVYYQKVLSTNGQYLPALTALADLKWKTGDRAGAAALYRRIVDQVGESPGYGQMAAKRLHELNEASSAKSSGANDGEKATPAATPTASTKVDLTDRPGKQP